MTPLPYTDLATPPGPHERGPAIFLLLGLISLVVGGVIDGVRVVRSQRR